MSAHILNPLYCSECNLCMPYEAINGSILLAHPITDVCSQSGKWYKAPFYELEEVEAPKV